MQEFGCVDAFFLALYAHVLKVITSLCNPLLPRSHAYLFHCFMCSCGVFRRKFLSVTEIVTDNRCMVI